MPNADQPFIKPGRQNQLPKINCQMRVDWLTKSGRLRLRRINKFPPNADYFNQTRTVENQLKFSSKCGSILIKSGRWKNQRRQILKRAQF